MAGGAANVAVALFGDDASENLVVLPADVNSYGLLDAGVGVTGTDNPLEGLAGLLVVRDDPTMRIPGALDALRNIDTVVVIDNVLHETAKRASAVIAEGRAYASQGTYTQGDYREGGLALPACLRPAYRRGSPPCRPRLRKSDDRPGAGWRR
jgi:hypothetical protein